MEKSTILDKKLLNYVSASAALLATGAAANAQVVYTDVTPDAVLQNTQGAGWATGAIDFNNDATMDFTIALFSTSGGPNASVAVAYATGTNCAGGNPANEVMGSMPSAYNYVHKLNMNDPIGASGNWLGTNCVQGTMGYRTSGGASPYNEEWNNGVTDGYMGVRFDIAGSIHYGWARMDVSADHLTLTLKDYAYDATPNTTINAGDMGVGISENIANDVAVYNNNNLVTVKVTQELTNGSLQVVSTSGQVVKEFAVAKGSQVFDLNDLAAGLYVVNLTFEEGVATKKIAIN
jgi:hypothetical protein